jgi:hypothetical protein
MVRSGTITSRLTSFRFCAQTTAFLFVCAGLSEWDAFARKQEE